MKKLNMDYHTKYCVCCGRKSETIWKFLQKQKPKVMRGSIGVSKKEWKGHSVYKNKESFYDTNKLEYCGNCGEKLDYEDIHTTRESRGECFGTPCSETIVVGYKCSKCDYEEKY